jgi:hypothetical protein
VTVPLDTTDHIAIDGTPLADIGRLEAVWEGVLGQDYPDATPDPLGDGTIPDWEPLAIPRPITIGMLIRGETRGEFMARRQALATLVDRPADILEMGREVTVGTTVTTATRPVKFMGGLDPTMVGGSNRIGRVALRFQPLAGWT